MGRKKTYDRNALIGTAMEMFRDHGFSGTSTQMLVDGLKVNRYSLYAEFRTKQTLFEEALVRYNEDVLGRSFGPLEAPGSGVAEVRVLLEFYGSANESPGWGRGCLLCNTAVEVGPNDPSDAGLVQQYFERLSNAFNTALENAHRNGQLQTSVKPRQEADYFTATILGLFVMLRAEAPSTVIQSAVRAAIEHLEALCVGPSPR